MPPATFLGLDAGGTHTRAVLCSASGEILAKGQAGPGNPAVVGLDAAWAAVETALAPLWSVCSVPPLALHAGFAGLGSSGAEPVLRERFAALPGLAGTNLTLSHDLRTAWAGAFLGQPGIVLIAGTGSAAYASDSSGRESRAGGWGPLLDDDAGAYGLARDALRWIVRAEDGRVAPTSLREAALAFFACPTLRDLVARIHSSDTTRARLAAFAPAVLTQADTDAAARLLAEQAAQAAAALIVRLHREHPWSDGAPRLAVIGGLGEAPRFRESLRLALSAADSSLLPESPACPPVLGAVWLAAHGMGRAAALRLSPLS